MTSNATVTNSTGTETVAPTETESTPVVEGFKPTAYGKIAGASLDELAATLRTAIAGLADVESKSDATIKRAEDMMVSAWTRTAVATGTAARWAAQFVARQVEAGYEWSTACKVVADLSVTVDGATVTSEQSWKILYFVGSVLNMSGTLEGKTWTYRRRDVDVNATVIKTAVQMIIPVAGGTDALHAIVADATDQADAWARLVSAVNTTSEAKKAKKAGKKAAAPVKPDVEPDAPSDAPKTTPENADADLNSPVAVMTRAADLLLPVSSVTAWTPELDASFTELVNKVRELNALKVRLTADAALAGL